MNCVQTFLPWSWVKSRYLNITGILLRIAISNSSTRFVVRNMINTPQSSIDTLHAAGKQVICYFSAGTYEPNRPDSAQILSDPSAVGATLDGWPNEKWLDIRTDFIVNIMKARIDTAVSKGCDGVDPDNGDYLPFLNTVHSLSPNY
jgi:hypothetical protein